MEHLAEGQEFKATRAFSILDWPTLEMLVAAHRARGIALRDMTLALAGRLKMLVADLLLPSNSSRDTASPGGMPVTPKR